MTTERLYYRDCRAAAFRAAVVEAAGAGRRVYLDRSAFYPTSGGQPHDTGFIGEAAVLDVIDEEERVAHLTDRPVAPGEVECRIDWARRFDHMQQHTGQHLLSAVVDSLFGGETVAFHLGAESCTIDIALPALTPEQVMAAEQRANEVVAENRPVSISFEENSPALGLRKPSDREGLLRIVSIEGFDRSACCGTHVTATGEIGAILIRKIEKIRNTTRVEFLCGARAIRRARADYDALLRIARQFSAQLDEAPALVAAQAEALEAAAKSQRKLSGELARIRGGELYRAAEPNTAGVRVARVSLDDDTRSLAQGFTAGSKAVLLATSGNPPALFLAVSADAGLHAGNLVKAAVTALGGRGGGSAQSAQGAVPTQEALEQAIAEIAQSI